MSTGAGAVRVAVFCMEIDGHFNRCRPVIAELIDAGAEVVVFTSTRYASNVLDLGARFADLFRDGTPQDIDDSLPEVVRYVPWTAVHAAETVLRARRYDPALVVADDFAVVARVVADALDLPLVTTRASHLELRDGRSVLHENSSRLRVSARALAGARRLAAEHGLAQMSPVGFVTPHDVGLDLIAEPDQFVSEADRALYRSAVCFGSVLPSDRSRPDGSANPFPPGGSRRLYVAVGTIVWRYWWKQTMALLTAVRAALDELPEWSVLVSLGGAQIDAVAAAELSHPNLEIVGFVDQWSALAHADAFLTHHGLNSTHEAIDQQVPMISCPYFADQPARARRCQEFDCAVALRDDVDEPVDGAAVISAIRTVESDRARLARGLARARVWEDVVIRRRPSIVARMLDGVRGVEPVAGVA